MSTTGYAYALTGYDYKIIEAIARSLSGLPTNKLLLLVRWAT
ncbi:hypothetical protein [Nostoc sp.]